MAFFPEATDRPFRSECPAFSELLNSPEIADQYIAGGIHTQGTGHEEERARFKLSSMRLSSTSSPWGLPGEDSAPAIDTEGGPRGVTVGPSETDFKSRTPSRGMLQLLNPSKRVRRGMRDFLPVRRVPGRLDLQSRWRYADERVALLAHSVWKSVLEFIYFDRGADMARRRTDTRQAAG